MTPKQLRRLCPAALRGAYLNAAASSPLPLPVERAASEHLHETVEHGDIHFGRWLAEKERIRGRFAHFIGATAAEVAFLSSTSMGFFVVGQMLRQLGVREVVTFAQEFPSTTVPLLHQGIALSVVRPREDGRYALEDVERALGRRTGALVVSAVQYASGFRADLSALGKLCKARGITFVVNAAQALGQVPVNVQESQIDLLCGTSHKWMMGGFGTGVFFARAALLEKVRLPFAGWLSAEQPMAMDPFPGSKLRQKKGGFVATGATLRCDASALEIGAGAFAPLFGFGAALGLIEQLGVPRIDAHNRVLQAALRSRLRSLGFSPNAPDEPSLGSGICVFPVAGDPRAAASALARRKVWVSPRGVGLRVSTHAFNVEEDLEQLFSALHALKLRPA